MTGFYRTSSLRTAKPAKVSLLRAFIVLFLALSTRSAIAQPACSLLCNPNQNTPCGTSCTFTDQFGNPSFSFCGSAQFPFCVAPPKTPASPYSAASHLSSFLDPTGATTGGPFGQAIFYRGTDQHVHHIFSSTTWFTDDPTAMTSAPLAVSGSSISSFLDTSGLTTGAPHGQAIFYVGTDQRIYHLYSNTAWFADSPTLMTGAPLAVSGSPITSFLDATGVTTGGTPGQAIFYIGIDQHIHHFFTDTTWHTDDPTAMTGATLATF